MEYRDLKFVFGEIALEHGFSRAGRGWLRETPVALLFLDLQRSNFGRYADLNIKLFLQNERVVVSPDVTRMLERKSGDVFLRQPKSYGAAFELDSRLDDFVRKGTIGQLFVGVVSRIVAACATPSGLLELRDEGSLYLLPAAEARLAKLWAA
jgi:hypothetical protein